MLRSCGETSESRVSGLTHIVDCTKTNHVYLHIAETLMTVKYSNCQLGHFTSSDS